MRTALTRLTFIAAMVLMMSCDRSATTGSVVKTFTLLPWMESDTGKNATLSISVPSSWIMKKDVKDMISFRPPDVAENESLGKFNVNLFSCSEPEKGAACIQKWVDRHFQDAAPGALLREEVGAGRVWITSSAGKDGKGVSARYYLVSDGRLAVVNFQLGGETLKHLAAFKEAGGTLAFAGNK